jgi:hypothetical protein
MSSKTWNMAGAWRIIGTAAAGLEAARRFRLQAQDEKGSAWACGGPRPMKTMRDGQEIFSLYMLMWGYLDLGRTMRQIGIGGYGAAVTAQAAALRQRTPRDPKKAVVKLRYRGEAAWVR